MRAALESTRTRMFRTEENINQLSQRLSQVASALNEELETLRSLEQYQIDAKLRSQMLSTVQGDHASDFKRWAREAPRYVAPVAKVVSEAREPAEGDPQEVSLYTAFDTAVHVSEHRTLMEQFATERVIFSQSEQGVADLIANASDGVSRLRDIKALIEETLVKLRKRLDADAREVLDLERRLDAFQPGVTERLS